MSVRMRERGHRAFNDRVEAFAQERKDNAPRIERWLGPSEDLEQNPGAVREALDHLRVQHEELIVAEEELKAQVEELARVGIQLESERTRYADLFNRAPDAYLVVDRTAVVREANPAAVEMLGVERRFLRGKPLPIYIVSADHSRVVAAFDAIDAQTTLSVDMRLRPRGREPIDVVARLSLTGTDRRILCILRPTPSADATATSLARALRDKEELLGRERRAREELERTNRAKDRFIAILAHDLRAPLNAVLGWTQMLRREVLDRGARDRALETVERNARAQARLIEELLDISRMAADRVQLDLVALDVGALVCRTVEAALPQASEAGLELSVKAEDALTVVGDGQRLQQIMTNLLSNALKYTAAGGKIAVAAFREGRTVKITVADTGKGISAALLPQVFDMYFQDRTDVSSRSGLGLGLYIVKQLVDLQGGCVSVASDGDDRGATFTVELPFRDELTAASSSRFVAAAPTSLEDIHVLVVDDEADSRELMATILRRAGAEVVSAGSTEAAVDQFGHLAPDVVVSDLAMPGEDGLALIARLRRLGGDFAALAVSGFAGESEADGALAAGFDVHIAKPIDSAELVEAVGAAARLRRE